MSFLTVQLDGYFLDTIDRRIKNENKAINQKEIRKFYSRGETQ